MSPVRTSMGTRASRPPDRDSGRLARAPGFASVGSHGFGKFCGFIARLPAFALLGLIRIYQRTLSPVLPAVFGSACGCRFAPTCSHYAAEAIQTHGALAGTVLAAVRLLKCSPLHPGGFDPVPPRRSRRMCVRSAPVSFPTSPASRLSPP